MTPDDIRERKERGFRVAEPDLLWLADLSATLAKAILAIEPLDFGCAVCRKEEGHAERCPVTLAEAVARGRWRVLP